MGAAIPPWELLLLRSGWLGGRVVRPLQLAVCVLRASVRGELAVAGW